jgi:arginyl-tRNA synthetase
MFQQEQQIVENQIRLFCADNEIPFSEMRWSPIPFSGEWGISTSFFQTAANEAKAGKGTKTPVPLRAQQIAGMSGTISEP